MRLSFAFLALMALWALFGSPQKNVANWMWPETVAPWERVDAYYYPNRSNLTRYRKSSDVGSVQGCRDAVFAMAAAESDPDLQRGDYECGVGELEGFAGMTVYRITVR